LKIEIWSDFACPFCYIGKKKFESALAKFTHHKQVEVIYRAYQLNPYAPKVMEGSAYEVFAKGHDITLAQAKEKFEYVTKAANKIGLEYRYDIIQMTNTFDAHRLAKWAKTQGLEHELTERLMKAYFIEGKNIADEKVLVKLASDVHLNEEEAIDVLRLDRYVKDVKQEFDDAKKLGVSGVPFFVLNRKYGVSGAQEEEYFLQVLEHLWQEEHPITPLKGGKTEMCTDEGCIVE
jgi:predicted DsbA family dithiol-disulfide isomerase